MAGYLGARPVVVQVDGYQRTEAESRYVNVSGDDFTGHLDFNDDAKARFGNSDEMHIYTESSGSGYSYIQGDNIVIRKADQSTNYLTALGGVVSLQPGGGKVGIGTSSIDGSHKLQVEETTSNTGVGIKIESASWDSTLTLANGSHSWEILNDYSNSSALNFYNSQTSANALVIDSSSNVTFLGSLKLNRTSGYTTAANWEASISHVDSSEHGTLFLVGDTSTGGVRIKTNTTNEVLHIEASGKVGIGESNPLSMIQISTSTGESDIRLHRTDTSIANNDIYGNIFFSGDDSDTNANGIRGFIRGKAQGTGGGMKLEFGTAGGGTAIGSDPRMTIDADGNAIFGGYSSGRVPVSVLVPHSNSAIANAMRISTYGLSGYSSSNSLNAGAKLQFGQYDDGYDWVTGSIASVRTGGNWGGDLVFYTNNNSASTNETEVMRLTSGGFPSFTGASDIRLTLGSTGTAGTNSATFLRGNSAKLQYNSASGDHEWEVGGAQKMVLTSSGNLVLSDGDTGIQINTGTDNSDTANIDLHYNGTAGGHEDGIRFFDKRDAQNAAIVNSLYDDGVGTARASIVLKTANAGTLSEVARFDGTGVVGIGTQNPGGGSQTAIIGGVHILDHSFSNWTGSGIFKTQCALRVETYYKGNNDHARAIGDYGGGIGFNHLAGYSSEHGDNLHAWIGLKVFDMPGHERSSLVFATNNVWSGESNHDAGCTERMRISPDGTVQINTQLTFGGTLNLYHGGVGVGDGSSAGDYRRMYWNTSNSDLRFWNGSNEGVINSSGAFVNASDVNLKKDIADIDYGINTVKSLKPRKYKLKSSDLEQVGFIAQEMETQVPEVVTAGTNPDGDEQKGISYGQLTAVLTKAIQEQQTVIEALTARIEALEA